MKPFIAIFIIAGIAFGGWKIWEYWKEKEAEEIRLTNREVKPDKLAGLPYQLEESLAKAQQGGAKTLKPWLEAYRRSVQDPRLASIELDYVLLIARDDPKEARRVFAEVKKRTSANSPVYPRVKQLEATYQ